MSVVVLCFVPDVAGAAGDFPGTTVQFRNDIHLAQRGGNDPRLPLSRRQRPPSKLIPNACTSTSVHWAIASFTLPLCALQLADAFSAPFRPSRSLTVAARPPFPLTSLPRHPFCCYYALHSWQRQHRTIETKLIGMTTTLGPPPEVEVPQLSTVLHHITSMNLMVLMLISLLIVLLVQLGGGGALVYTLG